MIEEGSRQRPLLAFAAGIALGTVLGPCLFIVEPPTRRVAYYVLTEWWYFGFLPPIGLVLAGLLVGLGLEGRRGARPAVLAGVTLALAVDFLQKQALVSDGFHWGSRLGTYQQLAILHALLVTMLEFGAGLASGWLARLAAGAAKWVWRLGAASK